LADLLHKLIAFLLLRFEAVLQQARHESAAADSGTQLR
jgi:hypothetical protein